MREITRIGLNDKRKKTTGRLCDLYFSKYFCQRGVFEMGGKKSHTALLRAR